MRKKLLSILLVLSLMLALVPAAFAADAVRTELESDGTTLAFYGSGVATADCWNGDWTAVTHVDLGYEIRGVARMCWPAASTSSPLRPSAAGISGPTTAASSP